MKSALENTEVDMVEPLGLEGCKRLLQTAQELWYEEHRERELLQTALTSAEEHITRLNKALSGEIRARERAEENMKFAERCLNMGQQVTEQAIGSYTFRNYRRVNPEDVQPNDAFAITLVGIAGHGKDWTCYSGQAGRRPAEIASRGDKVPEHHAAIFSHVMQKRFYRG